MLLHLEKLGNGIFLKYIINTSQVKVGRPKKMATRRDSSESGRSCYLTVLSVNIDQKLGMELWTQILGEGIIQNG